MLALCAHSSAQQVIPAGEPRCDESVTRACSAAVAELRAARDLIAAQQKELDAMSARLAIEQERAGVIQQKLMLMGEQNQALIVEADAAKQARGKQEQLLETYRQQIAKLQEDIAGGRKRAIWLTIAGFVTGVLVRR